MAYQPEWQNRRTPPPDQATRDRMRANLERNIAESRSKGYMRADFSDLLKPLKREAKKTIGDQIAENMRESEGKKKKPTKGEIKNALKNGQTLNVTTASDCFESLTAEVSDDGMVLVTGTFRNPTRGDWQYEMPLDLFLEWANDDLGVFFNQVIRGAYEV